MSKKSNTIGLIVTIIFVLAALVAIFAWLGVNPSTLSTLISNKTAYGSICNTTLPTRPLYSPIFYSQGQVFCIPRAQIVVSNLSVPSYPSQRVSINGSYSASTNTEFYILNSVQYGQFSIVRDKITNYTLYSGNNQGATIPTTNLAGGDTYYLVFYTTSTSLDT